MSELKIESPGFKEEDLKKIKNQFELAQKSPESEKTSPREVLKESIKSLFPPEKRTASESGRPESNEANLPAYLRESDPAVKDLIQSLIAVAYRDGPAAAVAAASKHGDFILDAFHDALTEKLYPELVRRGLIKE